jgi:hypothetical protein
MIFYSLSIANADDGSPVAFAATGGSVTLTRWGTALGDRLSGTFSASITGTRTIGLNASGESIEEALLGTMTGTFDVTIKPDS